MSGDGAKTRYFLDTEFIEAPFHLDPVSIALVCDDGREFYAINAEADHSRADPWVVTNVLAKLPPRSDPRWMTRAEIALTMRAFVAGGAETPEFWAYFADYDWVLFCWLLGGRMIDMPNGWPMYCMDLKQSMDERGLTKLSLPPMSNAAHDALVDARWVASAWASVHKAKRKMAPPDPAAICKCRHARGGHGVDGCGVVTDSVMLVLCSCRSFRAQVKKAKR